MAININKIRKIAAKETIKQAKKEIIKMKERKEKINPIEFEEYIKIIYRENFNKLKKKAKQEEKSKPKKKFFLGRKQITPSN